MKKDQLPYLPKNLKRRQQKSFELLKVLDKICRENNLWYSLAYGTLLGATRNKKQIAWDTDIDVLITEETYEFLKKHYPQYILDNTTSHHFLNFPRFVDKIDQNDPNNIYIDMFIIVPSTWKKAKKINNFWYKLRSMRRALAPRKWFINIFGNILMFIFGWMFLFWVPPLDIKTTIEKTKVSEKEKEMYYITNWPNKRIFHQVTLTLEQIENGMQDIEMNGHYFKSLKENESVLERWYGKTWRIPIQTKHPIYYGYYEFKKVPKKYRDYYKNENEANNLLFNKKNSN